MKMLVWCLFLVFKIAAGAPSEAEEEEDDGPIIRYAVCRLTVGDIKGNIRFFQENVFGPVRVMANLSSVPPGEHGFHIHNLGDLSAGCPSTGNHFNPGGKPHGGPQSKERHVGDLGNLFADEHGVVDVQFKDYVISLNGLKSLIGLPVVIHQRRDDLGEGDNQLSKKTGNAGAMIACGVIGIAKKFSIN